MASPVKTSSFSFLVAALWRALPRDALDPGYVGPDGATGGGGSEGGAPGVFGVGGRNGGRRERWRRTVPDASSVDTNLDRPGAGDTNGPGADAGAGGKRGVSSRISEGTRVASDRSRSHPARRLLASRASVVF